MGDESTGQQDDHQVGDVPERVAAWRSRGELAGVGDDQLFVLDEGPGDSAVLVLLHGFPGSSYDWCGVVDALSGRWRMVCFDLPGYGLSDKPADRPYSLFAQTDLAERLLADRGITRAVLVAHDMGDTVAAELLARSNQDRGTVEWPGCVLTNGSIFIDMAQLTAGQQGLLALPDEPLAEPLGADGLRLGLAASFPEGRPEPDELDAMVWLSQCGGGDRLLPRLIRYIEERRQHQPRWTAGLVDFPGPVVAAWGDLDPIAVSAMPDKLGDLRTQAGRPVEVVHWPDLGHWPSIEAPDIVAGLVADRTTSWW